MAWLVALAMAGQGFIALLTLILARNLDPAEFEAYVIASAIFILVMSVAPLGAEKLALRVLPRLLEAGAPGPIHDYLRWAARRMLVGTLAAVSLTFFLTFFPDWLPSTSQRAVVLACLAVPAGVAAHFGLEILTAGGQARFATLVLRLVVPGTALAAVAVLVFSGRLDVYAALLSWGAGWLVSLLFMSRRLTGMLCKTAVRSLVPTEARSRWSKAARSLWLYRFALAFFSQSALLALEVFGAPPSAVGAYAAASGIAAVGLVLATATNRAYARELALLMDLRDFAGMAKLRGRRLRWLLPSLVISPGLAFAFGPEILTLFRPEFVADGVGPLRILAAATTVSIVFSLAPTYLKYRGRNRSTFVTVAACALLQIVLLRALIPGFGATGAAAAHGISVLLMYGTMAHLGQRELARLSSEPRSKIT